MEINKLHGSAINTYKKVSLGNSAAASKDNAEKAPNTDKIEFDFTASIGAAKINIASSIEADANTARIEQLQQAYSGECCPTTAEETARIITGE